MAPVNLLLAVAGVSAVWLTFVLFSWIWLEFFYCKGIYYRLSSRVNGGLLTKLYPGAEDIEGVATKAEFADYLRFRQLHKIWWRWMFGYFLIPIAGGWIYVLWHLQSWSP